MDKNMQDKVNLLKSMHFIIRSLNDENAYMTWIYTVPDEPDDSDFEDLAGNPVYMDKVCALFTRLIKKYASSGYVGGDESWGLYEKDDENQLYRYIPHERMWYSADETEFIKNIDEDTALYYNPIDGHFITEKL